MNLKIIFLIGLFINSAPVFASEERLSMCEKEGENFGNGQGRDLIPYECVELFKKSAAMEANKTSASGLIQAYGYRNMIFIKLSDKLRVISGSYTELDGITALAIDEANQEIGVLSKKGDVLFFSSRITGNVAPLRILKNKELQGANDLVINSKKNEVVILNQATKSLYIFSRLANSHAPEKSRKLAPLRIVRNLVGHQSIALDVEHQELFTLNSVKKMIQVFDLSASGPSVIPVRSLSLPPAVLNPKKVEYLTAADQLVLSSPEGQTVVLPRGSAVK